MQVRTISSMILAVVFLGFGVITVMAQENTNATTAVPAQPAAAVNEPLWLWGEVISINPQAKTMSVRYLDYDTDVEKEMTLTVNEKTKLEGVQAFEAIKPQDTISVDYTLSGADSGVALTVSVEKIEDMGDIEEEPKATEAPAEVKPAEAPAVNQTKVQ